MVTLIVDRLKCRPRRWIAYREEFGRILATLIRLLGDFDIAEDPPQEAFAAALSNGRAKAHRVNLGPGSSAPRAIKQSIGSAATAHSAVNAKKYSSM
jgi:hypothetical protein